MSQHLAAHPLLTACLLRLPFRFDLTDVRFLVLPIPVAGALALFFVAGHVSAFHVVLLSVGGGCMTICLFFALAPSGGPRPVHLGSQRCLGGFRLPSAIVMF